MSRAEKTTHLGFDMEGAWFADFCRTRLQEGDWEIALRNLTECIGGLSTDQAISILKGEATFTGWASDEEGIKLVDVKKTDPIHMNMKEIYDRLYGNVFRYGDRYYKPYAFVVGPWIKEDYDFMINVGRYGTSGTFKIIGDNSGKARAEQGLVRSMFYANKPHEDLMVVVSHGKTYIEILCEITRTPPFWVELSNNDPVGFLKQRCDKGLKLEGRGARIDDESAVVSPRKISQKEAVITKKPTPENRAQQINHEAMALIRKVREALENTDTVKNLAWIEKDYNGQFSRISDGINMLTDKVWDEHAKINANFENLKVQSIRKGVLEQAEKMGGFYTVNLKRRDESVYSPAFVKIAKNPFIRWCLRHFDYEAAGKTRPEWSNISYSGLKMIGDDPNHTDWFLGTGAPLEEAYSPGVDTFGDVVMQCIADLQERVIAEWTGQEFSVLSRGHKKETRFHGLIVFPEPGARVPENSVCVIPHAGPEYHSLLENLKGGCGFIITEMGGKLAHMSIVGREYGVTVIQVNGAMNRWQEGALVFLNLEKNELTQFVA